MEKKRKNYSAQEKVTILKKHLLEKIPVSDLCVQFDLHPTVFYRWQKEFFENGANAFTASRNQRQGKLERKVADLEQRLVRKHEVLSELMEEHVALKKSLGEI